MNVKLSRYRSRKMEGARGCQGDLAAMARLNSEANLAAEIRRDPVLE